jgi:hypothetical protein
MFCLIACISCIDERKILPPSTGLNSEVIFVVDDVLWENQIDSFVKQIFGASILGINQPESSFSIIQVNRSEFKSILKTHTNVIIISQGVKKYIANNKWANDQFVAQLNWDGDSHQFTLELIEIRNVINLKEVTSIKKSIKKSSQKKIETLLLNSFYVSCIIPSKYQIIKNERTLFWANYDPSNSDEIQNILIFSFVPKTENLQSEVLFKADSVFAKYLLGSKQESFVKIEPEYSPYFFQNTYRGLWRLENGFMGGPFLIKTYFVKNKIIVCAGLVFAPQSQKRMYIKEFEAIL